MSNAPTTSYRQHHDVEAPRVDATSFRTGWRVRTRLDQLHDARRITSDEWRAGLEYRAAHDAMAGGAPGGALSPLRASSTTWGGGGRVGRVDRASRVRAVERAIGVEAALICRGVCVLDLSWAALAARIGVRHDVTARDRAVDALRALAPAWLGARKGPGTTDHAEGTR